MKAVAQNWPAVGDGGKCCDCVVPTVGITVATIGITNQIEHCHPRGRTQLTLLGGVAPGVQADAEAPPRLW